MFFLQRQRKSVYYGAKNFKQFGYAIKSFRLVDKLEEDVVD